MSGLHCYYGSPVASHSCTVSNSYHQHHRVTLLVSSIIFYSTRGLRRWLCKKLCGETPRCKTKSSFIRSYKNQSMLPFLQKLLFSAIVLLVYSCSDNGKNESRVFKVLNAGLANSSRAINYHTATIYHNLENKVDDPFTHYRGAIWYSKAMQGQKFSSGVFDYIQGLKNELLKEAGFDEDHLSIDEDKKEPVDKLFAKDRKDVALSQKLKSYKDSMMLIDPIIKQEFINYSLIPEISANENDKVDSITVLFKDVSTVTAIAALTQFQNNVKIFENKVVSLCNIQVTNDAFIIDCSIPTPIISQSSMYVRASDELTIKAGLGKFDTRDNPKVLINNKAVDLNDHGYAEFRCKARPKPGSYSVPIRIEYSDQDGNTKVIDRVVKYTVIN